jgi:hypothetical protein
VVAIVVPVLLYFLQNLANRRKATLDWIVGPEASTAFVQSSRVFSSLRQGIGFAHLWKPVDEEAREQRLAVLTVLNHYEMTALHISQGVLDQHTYRRWMQSALIRDWMAARDFVRGLRWAEGSYRAGVYSQFEEMIVRWAPEVRPIVAEEGPPAFSAREAGDAR